MTRRKYEFTGEVIESCGRTLRRIRRITDGEIGGWIEWESNLSHVGDCWVADETHHIRRRSYRWQCPHLRKDHPS